MADPASFPVPPVIKRVVIGLPIDAAFDRLTAGLGSWWPTATHSVSGEGATVWMECAPGGSLIEQDAAGNRHVWGRITHWDPPRRVAFTWHPGRSPETAQVVSISLLPAGREQTSVELVHSGWEALGSAGRAMRESYEAGWAVVLGDAYARI